MESLICLNCKGGLNYVYGQKTIECMACNASYPVIDNIPVLIDEKNSIFKVSDFLNHERLFFETNVIYKAITSFLPPLGINWAAKGNYRYLSEELTNSYQKTGIRPSVLVLGGSIAGKGMTVLLQNKNIDIVESDVSFGPRTQIIFDGHQIPFSANSFDLIICQAVLEHVINPEKCVSEIYRTLKNDGIAYIETPFMQQVHGGPYDFTRYSHSGHRLLLKDFQQIDSGPSSFAGTALFWSYYYFLQAVFGFTPIIKNLVKIFARFSGFIFVLFDLIIIKSNRIDGASGFYFIGRKNKEIFNYKDIVNYYKNARGI